MIEVKTALSLNTMMHNSPAYSRKEKNCSLPEATVPNSESTKKNAAPTSMVMTNKRPQKNISPKTLTIHSFSVT